MKEILRDDIVAIDINAPQGLDLQQFTPEQIDDFCKSAGLLCDFNKMPSLVVALQIIRQLQWACGMYHKTFVQPRASSEA